MRSQHVFTHLRCNQNCTYCTFRRTTDDPRLISEGAILRRVADAVELGAEEITLTGGEPTMRGDLASLVRGAIERGAKTVVLETNATLIDRSLAEELEAAGLSKVRVNLAGFGPELDAVTRDEGGFAATMRGLAAIAGTRMALEISVTLVRSTVGWSSELPGAIVAALGDRVSRVVAVVPASSPEETELLSHEESARALSALDRACKRHGMRLQLAEGSGPPPCVFTDRAVPHHLYSLTPGGADAPRFEKLAGCATCVVRDRCPGVEQAYLQRHPGLSVTPISDDRSRRRLSIVGSVEQQIARELAQPSYNAGAGGRMREDVLVRVNFNCNQSCDFCFVSTHLPSAREEEVRRIIVESAKAGKKVILTGGEPTLNPRLPEYLRLAREHWRVPDAIQVQTNATLLDDRARVDELVEAGMGAAFVSLHGTTAEISDAVTRAPGTFVRTIAGLDNLAAAGVELMINFVICAINLDDLPRAVELVAARWKGAELNVSFVAPSTDMVPRVASLIPRYSEALPRIDEALALGRKLGVEVHGFESMCGMPLCLVPARLSHFVSAALVEDGLDEGEFLHTDACASCDLKTRCWGIRRGYAEIHGTGELSPVRLSS